MGRPSDYTQELADRICAEIAEGRSLRSILREDDGMPAMSSVFKWLRIHTEFAEQYARAREAQADALADELLEIADDGSNDWMERLGEDGKPLGWKENGEAIQRSRLRVDTRKWIASKLKPKKYGDKIEHSGPEGGPIPITITPTDVSL